MKKAVSITLSLLILAAMLHVSVVTHYCMGTEEASKISLSGKPISCGMENPESDLPLSGTHFNPQLCENVITFYAVENDYVPASFQGNESPQATSQMINFSIGTPVYSIKPIKSLYKLTSTSPPGELKSTDVELSDICIYRI
jgi:hypothetical protein